MSVTRSFLCRVKAGLLAYATRAWVAGTAESEDMRQYVMPVVYAHGYTVEIYASVWDAGGASRPARPCHPSPPCSDTSVRAWCAAKKQESVVQLAQLCLLDKAHILRLHELMCNIALWLDALDRSIIMSACAAAQRAAKYVPDPPRSYTSSTTTSADSECGSAGGIDRRVTRSSVPHGLSHLTPLVRPQCHTCCARRCSRDWRCGVVCDVFRARDARAPTARSTTARLWSSKCGRRRM